DDQPGPDYKEARNWEKREPRQSSTPEVPIPSPSQGAPNASSSPGIPKPFPQIN
ncbi:20182_t:CDS:2, partial [Rhizophagus irregularis]